MMNNIQTSPPRWSSERARDWQARTDWIFGFNYLPSSAVNSTEMWQGETFDAPTIEREFGWAHQLGYNSCRVFLPFIVWDAEPSAFARRFEQFLTIAARNHLSVMPIFFDDCGFSGYEPHLGRQNDPLPGVHNSRWTSSPGQRFIDDASTWPRLREYMQSIVGAHRDDARVVVWDVMNEPGSNERGDQALELLQNTFEWAREVAPVQPLTTGVWDARWPALNAAMLESSDIISFHRYTDLEQARAFVADLRVHNRPLICTEWMARLQNSRFAELLPFWKSENIGCYQWGLVNGRTQTHFPWGSPEGAPEPELWFHDILRADGSAYDEEEIAFIKMVSSQSGLKVPQD